MYPTEVHIAKQQTQKHSHIIRITLCGTQYIFVRISFPQRTALSLRRRNDFPDARNVQVGSELLPHKPLPKSFSQRHNARIVLDCRHEQPTKCNVAETYMLHIRHNIRHLVGLWIIAETLRDSRSVNSLVLRMHVTLSISRSHSRRLSQTHEIAPQRRYLGRTRFSWPIAASAQFIRT